MAKERVSFSFLGISVELALDSDDHGVAGDLKSDFYHFARPDSNDHWQVKVQLSSERPKSETRGFPFFISRSYRCYGWGTNRTVEYNDGSIVELKTDGDKRHLNIYSQKPERLRELGYLMILSQVGELLERKGFVRLHAAGLEVNNKIFILAGPSGAGKSTAAAQLMGQRNCRLFSDEQLLVRNRTVFSFPMRLALSENLATQLGLPLESAGLFKREKYPAKRLFQIEKSHIAAPAKPLYLICASAGAKTGPPERTVGLWSQIVLVGQIAIGWHLVQMAELYLRPSNTFFLIRVFVSRLSVALWMLMSLKKFHMSYSRKAPANGPILGQFILQESAKN